MDDPRAGQTSAAVTAHVVYDTLPIQPPAAGLSFNISEDTREPIALVGLTAGGANIPAAVMGPPTAGALYEVTFPTGVAQIYSNIKTDEAELAALGKQIKIFPFKPGNDRSVVVYAPAKDANGGVDRPPEPVALVLTHDF